MAEQLDMSRMSLNDSQHAPGPNQFQDRAAYIPPHLRGRPQPPPQMDGPPPMMNGGGPPPMNGAPGGPGGLHGSAWGPPPAARGYGGPPPQRMNDGGGNWANANAPNFTPRGAGGSNSNVSARGSGDGQWRDGKHIPGPANPRVERELFGVPNDPSKQHTGINFEKYDDIPVEASGQGVPEPVYHHEPSS